MTLPTWCSPLAGSVSVGRTTPGPGAALAPAAPIAYSSSAHNPWRARLRGGGNVIFIAMTALVTIDADAEATRAACRFASVQINSDNLAARPGNGYAPAAVFTAP